MVSLFDLIDLFKVKSSEQKIATMASRTQTSVNATEKIEFDLPTDQAIAGINLTCAQDTDGTLVDNITEIRLTLDGIKTFKKLTGSMLKALSILNKNPADTGHYTIPILDPRISADPILGKNAFNSIVLEVDVAAGGTGIKNVITPTLLRVTERGYPWGAKPKLLVEKYNKLWQFGTLTGWQEVRHDRAWTAYGYLLELSDNGILSDTAFDKYTLQLIDENGDYTPYEELNLAQLKQMNKQMCGGIALPTGMFYLPFPDGLAVKGYTSVLSQLHVANAGTNVQAKVCERVTLG